MHTVYWIITTERRLSCVGVNAAYVGTFWRRVVGLTLGPLRSRRVLCTHRTCFDWTPTPPKLGKRRIPVLVPGIEQWTLSQQSRYWQSNDGVRPCVEGGSCSMVGNCWIWRVCVWLIAVLDIIVCYLLRTSPFFCMNHLLFSFTLHN
jgi:hypothetical protein